MHVHNVFFHIAKYGQKYSSSVEMALSNREHQFGHQPFGLC